MRTLSLTEWQPTTEQLTAEELDRVLAAQRYVSTAFVPGEEGTYRLTAGSRVGTIVLDNLRILIRPKIGLRNLFFLLGFRGSLVEWSDRAFPYEEENDLLRAIAWLFESEVSRAMGGGLTRGYVHRQEVLPHLRGRVDIGRQVTAHRGSAFPLECRFDEYTEDIELNQVLRGAHLALLRLRGLDELVMRRIRAWLRAFVDVEDVSYPTSNVPRLSFTRLNAYWEPAARLAELILQRESVSDEKGATLGLAFTVDMNALFEKFVEEIVAEEARAAGWHLVPQAPRRLTQTVAMRPDLVLERRGVDRAVGDAKYKRLDLAEMPHADLYQLLAYCVTLGLRRGTLIYATYEPLHREVVRTAGTELFVLGLDMTLPFDGLVDGTRWAARVLVDQAVRAERDEAV